ncbi:MULTISPECIES: pyridoxamine 5'-phosphate oxidase family protein [Roseomonadaceae]|uniref:Pyridoxamine 5'-phosphate oxidase family protein n=1 Tax=Falsiroseomonas oleicola TaxID=2801474 RepID=A0ABS6HD99_9PROT|nr:pyridoxamine 5'-phosphate oxidase family protein [Roseomonas oleicola]MBU8545648.1 pyridoxamine 5'-phosphate oxidase family protein [Roseomonas oleicola]
MDDLRDIYPAPATLAVEKQLDHLDAHARTFIARAPFLVMATADGQGNCDSSPRGDAPGFVVVLDDRRLLLPDRPGNNRVDSLNNLRSNPKIGLLFFVPGVLETLRVNGRAAFTTDPVTLQAMTANDRLPKSALEVTVEEVFFHCGKALKRSALWDPARHARPGEIPSLGRILASQTRKIGVEEAETRIAHAYEAHLY